MSGIVFSDATRRTFSSPARLEIGEGCCSSWPGATPHPYPLSRKGRGDEIAARFMSLARGLLFAERLKSQRRRVVEADPGFERAAAEHFARCLISAAPPLLTLSPCGRGWPARGPHRAHARWGAP